MPALLETGAYVSSKKSGCAPWMPTEVLEGGNTKRKSRQRIHGIVLTSAMGSKWKVRWDDGQIEDISKGNLRKDGHPDSDSERMVQMTMGGQR